MHGWPHRLAVKQFYGDAQKNPDERRGKKERYGKSTERNLRARGELGKTMGEQVQKGHTHTLWEFFLNVAIIAVREKSFSGTKKIQGIFGD